MFFKIKVILCQLFIFSDCIYSIFTFCDVKRWAKVNLWQCDKEENEGIKIVWFWVNLFFDNPVYLLSENIKDSKKFSKNIQNLLS